MTPLLQDSVSKLHLLKPEHEKALGKFGIKTIGDLLQHFPRDWQDLSDIKKIADIRPGEKINIRARVKHISNPGFRFRRVKLTEALLEDDTGNVVAVWFNQPYLKNTLKIGSEYYFSGKAQIYSAKKTATLQLQNPTFELVKTENIHVAGIIPVYQLTEGITQKQFRYWLKQGLEALADNTDLLPQTVRTRLKLLDLNVALRNIHFPEDNGTLEAARARLAFEELFLFQLAFQSYKKTLKSLPAPAISFDTKLVSGFVKSLPFALTHSQRLAAFEILKDLALPHPMNRLLEGEVGSGKTVVAGLAMYATAYAGLQSVLLAPTEILALQHYETLKKLFAHADIEIALVTRSHKIQPPTSNFQPPIVIGTHALLQEKIEFDNIGLLVVDEQHRFGVKQRQTLLRRSTPIEKQINTDVNTDLLYKDLTYKIRGAIFSVYNELGPGHKEIIYHKALLAELTKQSLAFDTEKILPVEYNGEKVGIYKPDVIVDNKIILEIKAIAFLGGLEQKQIWSYLKGSAYKLALLVNFGGRELQIKRIIHDVSRLNQRESASNLRKSALEVPHLLSMTATPIPRTLALAFYGDLDISRLKELPSGRKKIITKLVSPDKRAIAYEFIRKELARGRQAYVIVPLVGEPQTNADFTRTNADMFPSPLQFGGQAGVGRVADRPGEVEKKSVAAESEKLTKIFPEFQIGTLHGRMSGEEKKGAMDDFSANKIRILVSTTVVEVGVDVPNATIMIIENAERFGLATLHQLRGRVGRGRFQSLCILFAETNSDPSRERLQAVVNSTDGFALAEIDLKLRGAGEILGTKQSGYIPFKIAKLSDHKAIELAKQEALGLLAQDPKLTQYPGLAEKVAEISKEAHLE